MITDIEQKFYQAFVDLLNERKVKREDWIKTEFSCWIKGNDLASVSLIISDELVDGIEEKLNKELKQCTRYFEEETDVN